MNTFITGLGFGMFIGAVAMAFVLKDLIKPDTKIGKIVNRGRGNENDIAVEVKSEEKKERRKWFKKRSLE